MHPQRSSRGRQTFVSLFLAGMGLLFFSAVLIFLTGGFLTYGGGILLGMFLVGSFHWLVWGRALSDEVAGEREEEKLRLRALDPPAEDEDSRPGTELPGHEARIKIGPSQRFRRL